QLLDINPNTGEQLDYVEVSRQLEEKIRQKYSSEQTDVNIDYHIIGFAKVIGDITSVAKRVILFFFIALLITACLVIYYAQSVKFAIVPLGCSLVAVIWQLGLLPLFGFGIDPMSILVPFLVFAIGVSHGMQMLSAVRIGIWKRLGCETACRSSFRKLLVPGVADLLIDTVGFITILLIDVDIIQEMAVTASLGVAVIILTNLVLLPLLLSLLEMDPGYPDRLQRRATRLLPLWHRLSRVTQRKN
ncbi:MAG: MMPL family transporter, partial [Gammaproteobacteria bacterium]